MAVCTNDLSITTKAISFAYAIKISFIGILTSLILCVRLHTRVYLKGRRFCKIISFFMFQFPDEFEPRDLRSNRSNQGITTGIAPAPMVL